MVGPEQGQGDRALQHLAAVLSAAESNQRGNSVKLSIRDVVKTYGPVTALAGATLDLREGEFLTLLGPSGSGKTTLLMVVAGLVAPSAGEVWIDGRLATYAPPDKRDIGVVFQNYALFPHLTIQENIAFPLRMRRLPEARIRDEVRRALEGLWSSSAIAGSEKVAREFSFSCSACGLPDGGLDVREMSKFIFMIMLQDFMDPWTFNQKNLMKCCKEFLLPGGKQVPFCAYNTVGYREQARAQLVAQEKDRQAARRAGAKYEVQPVTFSFGTRDTGVDRGLVKLHEPTR